MMDARSKDSGLNDRRDDGRRDAGRVFGVVGSLLAVLGAAGAFFVAGASIMAGLAGVSLGVMGYLLGARRWGGAAIIFCIAALFIGLSASQNLF